MSRILVIESSARQQGSVSRQLTADFNAQWQGAHPQDEVTVRDLAKQLVAYAKQEGFTHVEYMPLAQHPFSGSWG